MQAAPGRLTAANTRAALPYSAFLTFKAQKLSVDGSASALQTVPANEQHPIPVG